MNLVKMRLQRKTSRLGSQFFEKKDKQIKFAKIERLLRELPSPEEIEKLLKETNTLEWYVQTRGIIV